MSTSFTNNRTIEWNTYPAMSLFSCRTKHIVCHVMKYLEISFIRQRQAEQKLALFVNLQNQIY